MPVRIGISFRSDAVAIRRPRQLRRHVPGSESTAPLVVALEPANLFQHVLEGVLVQPRDHRLAARSAHAVGRIPDARPTEAAHELGAVTVDALERLGERGLAERCRRLPDGAGQLAGA